MPHRRQKFRPTPSKSPATKRIRGSSAQSLFTPESGDDTYEAFPLEFTAEPLADVRGLNSSSQESRNYLQDSLTSDTLQSFSLSQRLNKTFRK